MLSFLPSARQLFAQHTGFWQHFHLSWDKQVRLCPAVGEKNGWTQSYSESQLLFFYRLNSQGLVILIPFSPCFPVGSFQRIQKHFSNNTETVQPSQPRSLEFATLCQGDFQLKQKWKAFSVLGLLGFRSVSLKSLYNMLHKRFGMLAFFLSAQLHLRPVPKFAPVRPWMWASTCVISWPFAGRPGRGPARQCPGCGELSPGSLGMSLQ